ncbi:MAG: aspartyl protease family protein [Sedimentisphaerales bacterium]|nr:aspartyl protease family protein [Sedimentisphaerales bacterium]
MKKSSLSIAIIIISSNLLLSGCQTGQTKVVAAPEVLAEFDFSIDEGKIILPVQFKGQEYPFLLDTGATGTIFDDSFKDKLGNRFLWPKSATLARGRKAKIEYYRYPDASLGPLKFNDLNLIGVLDCDLWFGSKTPIKYRGIIGMDILKKYIVQIDFDNGKVTFFKGKQEFDLFSMFKPKENTHPEWGEAIQMKNPLFSNKRFFVTGNLPDNTKAEFLIDSGWYTTNALNTKLFKKVKSEYPVFADDENITTDNEASQNRKIVNSFSLGNYEYENIMFQKNNESILGYDFLSRHIVTFDFPNKIMYFKKGNNYDKQPPIHIILGDTRFTINSRSHAVEIIDPNSLAYEKGIREKDVLFMINHYDISSLNVAELMNLPVSADENNEIIFTFKRGDEVFIVEFTKQDLEQNRD